MYQVSVPMILREKFDRANFLNELRRLGATRVMIVPRQKGRRFVIDDETVALLRERIEDFEALGYETCVWINALGHGGGPLDTDYHQTVNAEGQQGGGYCPLDPEFVADYSERVRRIASSGAKALMLDDDYRYAFKDGIGCFCEKHLQLFAERTGTYMDRETLVQKVYTGAPSPERDAWLKLLGDTLLDFARALRKAADEVNPQMRIGLCSSPSTWDTDGTDSMEIAKALAGPNTRPIHRFIGAPYWAQTPLGNQSLADTIELSKLQMRWLEQADPEFAANADTFAEGDVYPRPRFMTPAINLEMFDIAMRAAGNVKGILKYAVDYTSSPLYEHGYCDRAERNIPLYEQVEKRFSGKKAIGVELVEPMKKLARMTLPENFIGGSNIENLFFSQGIRFLIDNNLPIGAGGASIAFGGAAVDLPDDADGCILDLEAAKILTARGIDVGLDAVGAPIRPGMEYYIDEEEEVALTGSADWAAITPNPNARILTKVFSGENAYPGAYRYENADGRRFLVFAFTTATRHADGAATRAYCKRRLTVRSIEWLARAPLPVYTENDAPNFYTYAASDEKSTALLLWNGFADDIPVPVIRLNESYTRAEFVNCSGALQGDRVRLDRMEPFGIAVVELFK